ncbi:MAG: hypothetical protein PHC97_01845 [Patescibacteria group bacterium]|nr:hypothetical protein [Patescibacteria group bacterium]
MINIVIIIFLVLLISVAIASSSFAPWIPSRKKDLERIFRLANLKPGELFYDLGSGSGQVVIHAAKYKAKAIGLEIALPLYLISKIRQPFYRGTLFKYKNLFSEDLSKADVIYFFGTPRTINSKLKQKLEREAKPGARIISYTFIIEGWQPVLIDKPDKSRLPIYLYIR